jgi:hypothetical protein
MLYTRFVSNTHQVALLGAHRMIHASKAVLRSYVEWTNELRSTRFTPVEVLALAKGVQYVVIDPNQEALLLPLTVKRYTALLQDLTREGSSLTVLLGPGDRRSPPQGTTVTTEGFVTGDASPNQTSPPLGVKGRPPSLRRLVQKARLGLKGAFGLHSSSLFATRVTRHLSMKDGRVVTQHHSDVGWLVVAWGLYLHQLLGHPLRLSFRQDLYCFRKSLVELVSSHGLLYGMRYLKVSLFCIHKYLSGSPLSCTKEHGIAVGLSRSGLPKIIPVRWRHSILSGSKPVLRLVTSLFTLYKAVHTPCMVASLAPVIQELPAVSWVGFQGFCTDFFRKVGVRPFRYTLDTLLFSSKAGAAVKPAGLGWVTDAKSWRIVDEGLPQDPAFAEAVGFREGVRAPLFRFAEAFEVLPQVEFLYHNLLALEDRYSKEVMIPLSEARPPAKEGGKQGSYWSGHNAPGFLGKLCFLFEAAGKVRTIAIGDNFSQTLLKPIHEQMFSILKSWSAVDGTFDQQGAVDRFRASGYQEIFSFDLSKATDTIPHTLYLSVLDYLLGRPQAKAWLDLMVDRTFRVVKPFESFQVKEGLTHVRYTRGQPMGMYSSWGALALLHHLVIQYAAARVVSSLGQAPSYWRPGPLPFNDYLVLGDDMVLACKEVASEYQKFCSSNGIELSLSKSFISGRGFFNFASQSVLGAENVSPASCREHFSVTNLTARVSQLQNLVSKGFLGTETVGMGALLRGLFNPTAFKVVVRPSLTAGVVSTPIRLGITALASFKKFPSLKLSSPIRMPWLTSITGISSQVRAIWYNQMKPLELAELQLLARGTIRILRSLTAALRGVTVTENCEILRLRLLFPLWDPITKTHSPDGRRSPGMRYFGGNESSPSADAHALVARSVLLEEYNNTLSLEYGGTYHSGALFTDRDALQEALLGDLELILELVKIPGLRGNPEDLASNKLLAPWVDILEPPAEAGGYWGSPGWLIARLSKEIDRAMKDHRRVDGNLGQS